MAFTKYPQQIYGCSCQGSGAVLNEVSLEFPVYTDRLHQSFAPSTNSNPLVYIV